MAVETIKYPNGIEVTIITVHKICEVTLKDIPVHHYMVKYGKSVFKTDSRKLAEEEFKRLDFELAKMRALEKMNAEALAAEVESWKKVFPSENTEDVK